MDPVLDFINDLNKSKWKSKAPKVITPLIEQVCAELDRTSRAIFLTVTPAPAAQLGRCYDNVALAGLIPQNGWLLWELPDFYVTAEHHCVGLISDSVFKDVTPQVDGTRRVLFLPEKSRTQNPPVPSRYWPARDHPLLNSYVKLKEEAERFWAAGQIEEIKRIDSEICKIKNCYDIILAKRKEDRNRKQRRKDRKKGRSGP